MTEIHEDQSPVDKTRQYRQVRWATLGLSFLLVAMAVAGLLLWNNDEVPGWVFVASAAISVPVVILFRFSQRRRIARDSGRMPTPDQKALGKKILFWMSATLLALAVNLVISALNAFTDNVVGPWVFVVLPIAGLVMVVALARIVQLVIAARKLAAHGNPAS